MVSWFILLSYFFAENSYFGWNALPMSDTEMICDGIGFLMACLVAKKF